MERERRTEVATTDEPVRETAEDSHGHAHFHASGMLPAVAGDVAPPPPSASERAFDRGAADPTRLTAPVSRTVHGVTIVAPAGAHASAIDQVATIIGQELGKNQFAQRKMAEARATIVIIPARTKMTDLPQFGGLRGTTTFDGRVWDNVRGSGGRNAPDGSFAIGVAEENLIEVAGIVSSYPMGYSIAMHELAHTVESKGMTDAQRERLRQLFRQQQQQDRRDPSTHHDAFTDSYAASNEHEYFAQATNAFFNKNKGAEKPGPGPAVPNHNGKQWLYQNDPDMYAFLVEMYDTARDAQGSAAPANANTHVS